MEQDEEVTKTEVSEMDIIRASLVTVADQFPFVMTLKYIIPRLRDNEAYLSK